jgi:Holliday junction resolvase RusA-like endonuclease
MSSLSPQKKQKKGTSPTNLKKKTTDKKRSNKKKERETHFSVDLSCPCVSNSKEMKATILGIPLSYKRSGRNKLMSYDQQSLEKKSFVNAINNLFQISRKDIIPFGKVKVEVRATFIFTRKCIMNDVDNLTKFILDCFQIGNIYHDDRQVMKLTVEKKTGTQAMTEFHVLLHDDVRHDIIIDLLDEEDDEDNDNNNDHNEDDNDNNDNDIIDLTL